MVVPMHVLLLLINLYYHLLLNSFLHFISKNKLTLINIQLNEVSGSGKLSWANEDGTGTMDIHEGDVASLKEGSVFYIHSNLEAQRKKLRIYAIFTNTDDSTFVSPCTFILFLK
jgi:hypothetical protein